jgi:predicted MFS family arabinose efflux permease
METDLSSLKKPLYLMAIGAFAIATEAFMIAPLLPNISGDLSVSVSAAGQLVTVFAFTYALSSPILTTFTGSLNRRMLLIAALCAFAIANVVAALSQGYWSLMIARVLLAVAAGLYLPNANAVAGSMVAPERRGRALAIVNGGASVAIVFGVPVGAIVGGLGGWRMTFVGVAGLAAVAMVGLILGLPRTFGRNLPTATLGQRINVARKPAVLLALLSTTLWATGAYTVYTYIAIYMAATTGSHGLPLSAVVFIWGLSAVGGMILGGRFTDKLGPQRVLTMMLSVAVLAFLSLSAISAYVSPAYATFPVLISVVLWGSSIWGFIAPQQARLIATAGVNVAPVALSLNASFMYLGFSLGATLGAFTLRHGSVVDLGWVGALCEVTSLGMLLVTSRRSVMQPAAVPAT